MTSADDKLQRLFGGPALASLRRRLRRHFERHGDGGSGRSLQLTQLSAAEHEALALLSGRPPRAARSIRLDVSAIDAALRAARICDSLREALERLDGPITHVAAARAALHAGWSGVIHAPGRDARLQGWLQQDGSASVLKRLAQRDIAAAGTLLEQADAVMRHLPAAGRTRAQLAALTLGNAHGLDSGRPVASLVLAAWRHAEALDAGTELEPAETTPPSQPGEPQAEVEERVNERARDTWARAGVLVNELARPVLVLNLPGATSAQLGEPSYLSLRQLLRSAPIWPVGGRTVFVCENPNLLAIAADCLGARCAPLVCTDGMPAAAQRTLLNQLRQAGAELRYHGDFDWAGLRIANHVIANWEASPWRLAASDYEAAVRTAPHAKPDLDATGLAASWDESLAVSMSTRGLSIAEEAVADALMEDLLVASPVVQLDTRLRPARP